MKTQVYSLCLIMLLNFSFKGICQTDANIPYHGIAIYIDYPDAPASMDRSRFDKILNGVNYTEPGIQRSFRDYWYGQTRRNLIIHHDVFFYTATKPATYYETVSWQDGILLWKEALEWVVKNNPTYNWNSLSTSQNGGVTAVMIISSKLGPSGVGAAHGTNWTLSNGVRVNSAYGSVLKTPWDPTNSLFQNLHEGAHAIFGLPDTYDTDFSSVGTGVYSLMSGGKPDVEPVGGPFRVENKWGNILELKPGTHTITLEADGDDVLAIRNPHDPLEFFTIEARKKSTIGNSAFPANLGLLIWHSDGKARTSSNTLEDRTPAKHYTHSIEQADGLFQLENKINSGDIGDLYLPGNTFTNTTTPNTKWWDNSVSNISVTDIKFVGSDKISFTVTIPNLHTDHYNEIPQSSWKVISATPSVPGYGPEKTFDGDTNTFYHIPWANTLQRPHEIVLDLGKQYTMNEFYYTSNKNDVYPWEGRVGEYKIYISNDYSNWGSAVASATFLNISFKQYVLFAQTTGRYIKFSAINSAYPFINDVRTSIAEINIRGFDPNTLSVPNNFLNTDFLVYPNPTTGDVTLQLPGGMATITVINNLGQQIIKTQTTDKTTHLHLDNNGIYYISLTTSLGTITQKLIVSK